MPSTERSGQHESAQGGPPPCPDWVTCCPSAGQSVPPHRTACFVSLQEITRTPLGTPLANCDDYGTACRDHPRSRCPHRGPCATTTGDRGASLSGILGFTSRRSRHRLVRRCRVSEADVTAPWHLFRHHWGWMGVCASDRVAGSSGHPSLDGSGRPLSQACRGDNFRCRRTSCPSSGRRG